MSHTPPRDTTGFTPQSKKTKSFGALFDDAEEALDGLKRKIEAEATQDSPSSTHSHSERSEELSGAATELNSMVMQVNGIRKRIGVVVEKNVDAIIRKEDGDEKEYLVLRGDETLDGSSLSCFEDHVNWQDDKLKKAYDEHLAHNKRAICESEDLKKSLKISKKQSKDFFSAHSRGMFVLHYPPSNQVGDVSNLAFTVHKRATKENDGKQVLKIHSQCIMIHAELLAETKGLFKNEGERYEPRDRELIDKNGVGKKVRLVASASEIINYDLIERHPTLDDNKADVEKTIKNHEDFGAKYLYDGDDKFAVFIRQRQLYICKQSKNVMGSPTKAPVCLWGAGQFKVDDDRSGAQAPLFVALEKHGIEYLGGMFHPEYLTWKKNPGVKMAALPTDLAICAFVRATGSCESVPNAWRKFIGVDNASPAELIAFSKELSESLSTLGLLTWQSEGRPYSRKNELFKEFMSAVNNADEQNLARGERTREACAKFAQMQVMMEGSIAAAVRSLGLDEEDVAELDFDELQKLVQKYRREGLIDNAVRAYPGIGQREAVRLYMRESQLISAAEYEKLPIDVVNAYSQEEKEELMNKHTMMVTLKNACEAFDEDFVEAQRWPREEQLKIIDKYKLLGRCETLGCPRDKVQRLTDEERKDYKQKYTKHLALQKLGVTKERGRTVGYDGGDDGGDDGDDDSDDDVSESKKKSGTFNLTYEEGMNMTLKDLDLLLTKVSGSKWTKAQGTGITCAMAMGMQLSEAEAMSPDDLVRARIILSIKKGHEKNVKRNLVFESGSQKHAEIMERIGVVLRAYGLKKLSDKLFDSSPPLATFPTRWAFRENPEKKSSQLRYTLFENVTWKGDVKYYKRLTNDILEGNPDSKKKEKVKSTLALIVTYIYRERSKLFANAGFLPDELAGMSHKNITTKELGHRARVQKDVEENMGTKFLSANETTRVDFDKHLRALQKEKEATFQFERKSGEKPWWYYRICVAKTSGMYYLDDAGSWLGPTHSWLSEQELGKRTLQGQVAILNALDKYSDPVTEEEEEEEER